MIEDNYKRILESIEQAKTKLSLDYPIELMAVTKTRTLEEILELNNLGHTLFGENRVTEAWDKFHAISNKNFKLHIIGHLQRNKSKKAVLISDMIQSIDKVETLESVEKSCKELGKNIDFLIEVNTSYEPQKNGIHPDKLDDLLENIVSSHYNHCHLRGLMTIGPLTSDKMSIRKSFKLLKTLFDKTRSNSVFSDFNVLSMGMSNDYLIAIEEGSNLIRIGTSIFS